MIRNPIKCKERRICYLKRTVEFQPLTIAGRELEIDQSHKVLGLTIQNNLKWDEHIRSIIASTFSAFCDGAVFYQLTLLLTYISP